MSCSREELEALLEEIRERQEAERDDRDSDNRSNLPSMSDVLWKEFGWTVEMFISAFSFGLLTPDMLKDEDD